MAVCINSITLSAMVWAWLVIMLNSPWNHFLSFISVALPRKLFRCFAYIRWSSRNKRKVQTFEADPPNHPALKKSCSVSKTFFQLFGKDVIGNHRPMRFIIIVNHPCHSVGRRLVKLYHRTSETRQMIYERCPSYTGPALEKRCKIMQLRMPLCSWWWCTGGWFNKKMSSYQ